MKLVQNVRRAFVSILMRRPATALLLLVLLSFLPASAHANGVNTSIGNGEILTQACRDCAIRAQCTGNQFRSVSRLENEAVLDRMQARIAQRPDIFDQHRETVEHPFGTIKQWMNQGAFPS